MKDLKPAVIWRNFHALTQVPRPSGHLDKVRRFLLDFAQEKGVEAFEDEAGNIVMRKPATPGMENRKTVKAMIASQNRFSYFEKILNAVKYYLEANSIGEYSTENEMLENMISSRKAPEVHL